MNHHPHRARGFTLVEIAIVLVIIGLILGGIMNAQSVIRNAKTKDIIKAVRDMATGSQQFRDRYGAWPGDFATAFPAISGVVAACNGNGDGRINAPGESTCASEHLIRSSMLRGDAATPIVLNGNVTLSLTNRTTAAALPGLATLPVGWVNVLRIQNIDCDIAIQLDRANDDGNVASGDFRTGTACAGQNEAITVADAILRLN